MSDPWDGPMGQTCTWEDVASQYEAQRDALAAAIRQHRGQPVPAAEYTQTLAERDAALYRAFHAAFGHPEGKPDA